MKLIHNPWLLFLPFLLLYAGVVFLMRDTLMNGDAGRYFMYAENLLNGHYAPEGNKYLWNGPGFPIVLLPFVLLKAPVLVTGLSNAVFRYLSNVFLYKVMRRYTGEWTALAFSMLWALHFSTYFSLGVIVTESFTYFLVTIILYFTSLAFSDPADSRRRLYLVLAGAAVGFLVMTKVIFGYALLAGIAFSLFLSLTGKGKTAARQFAFIFLVALAVNLPYLTYTYQLTGRPFYWANSGGVSLYWMSTPFDGEYGDWQSDAFADNFKGRDVAKIKANHEPDFLPFRDNAGMDMDAVEKDDYFKEKAKQNIKAHPEKFLVNCAANINRMLFGFPNSFQDENLKFFKYLPNILLVTLMLYSLAVLLLNFRKTPYELRMLLLFILMYLGLSTIVSAEPRMFMVVMPVFFWWAAYSVDKTVTFNFHYTSKESEA